MSKFYQMYEANERNEFKSEFNLGDKNYND